MSTGVAEIMRNQRQKGEGFRDPAQGRKVLRFRLSELRNYSNVLLFDI